MPPPSDPFAEAVRAHQGGDLTRAEALYRRVLAANPNHPHALCNLGTICIRQGRADEALASYQAAIRADPGMADAWFNLGNAYRRLGRPAEAVAAYAECLRRAPSHGGAVFNSGLALASIGRLREALAFYEQAHRLEPRAIDVLNHLGDTLQKLGRVDEAVARFRHALTLNPADPRTHHNLGLAFAQRGSPDEAEAELREALRLRPDYPEAHNSLGVTLEASGRSAEAFAHYRRAVELKPDFAEALNNFGGAANDQGDQAASIAYRRRSLAIRPEAANVHSNLLLALHYPPGLGPEALFAEHRAWAAKHADALAPAQPPRPRDPDPERRLKVGYVSADFRTHTVAAFVEPLLASHAHDRFHITCFASVGRPDAVTQRFRGYADAWHDIHGMSDAEAAELVRRDGIDVLVDLGGHTAGNRLLVLARKPAPVQATLFGYPDTTGLRTVDYRITDALADPPGTTEAFSTEELFRLPELAWCYKPPDDCPDVAELPALANGYVTFGSLNNLAKVTPEMVALWAGLLDAVPGSRLVLLTGKGGFGAERMRDLFARHGVGENRLMLTPRQPAAQYFALHNTIDLYLDPFPYNGGVTTCDALWMGCPVVTLAGSAYFSRQGLALLTVLGLPDLIAHAPEQYVEIAACWASDRPRLAEVRAGLRERMRRSPVLDAGGYVRNLEAAYREMWRRACAKGA